MKISRKIEDKTGKEIKELYHEFMDLPRKLRFALDAAVILVLFLVLVAITPNLKYTILNAFGKANVKIKIIDSQASLPIMDATVKIGDETYTTDVDGIISLEHQELGAHKAVIEKAGYDTLNEEYVYSQSENTFEGAMKSNGKRIEIDATQYLSPETIKRFTVATTDDQKLTAAGVDGDAVIVVPQETTLELGAEVKSDGFMARTVQLSAKGKSPVTKINLMPNGEHFFLANRGGATTIYKSQLDGGEQKRLLEPTGFEGSDSKLYIAPSGKFAVYESSRRPDGGKRQLYLVNTQTGETKEFDSGVPAWQILDVSDRRVTYVAGKDNPADDKNLTLKTYDFQTSEKKELFASRNISFPAALNGRVVLAEQVERGSYPGGYLIRQLLAIDEASGNIDKLSENATITDIRAVTPTKFQYNQINPQSEAEVRFVYDTVENQTFQASVDRPAKQLLASPFEPDYYAWTIGATQLEFGDMEAEAVKSYSFSQPDLKIKQWINKDYMILHNSANAVGTNGYLIRTDSGETAILP